MQATPDDAEPVAAFVALGSNEGDRLAHLAFGIRALGEIPKTAVVAVSPVYETAAVGPPQRAYLNAVAEVRTRIAARALLEALLAAEARAGRVRDPGERNAPRTLDLDLLLYGELRIDEPGLEVPHPRLCERAFVLVPLADVAPALVHPATGESLAALAAPHRGEPGIARWPDALDVPPASSG